MPGNRLTLLCCLEGSTPEDRYLTRRRILLWLQGSLFVLPTAVILFSGGLEGPAGRTGSYGIGLLPRLVLSRDL